MLAKRPLPAYMRDTTDGLNLLAVSANKQRPAAPHLRSLFAPTWLFVAVTAWPFNSRICSTAPLSNPVAQAATAVVYRALRWAGTSADRAAWLMDGAA